MNKLKRAIIFLSLIGTLTFASCTPEQQAAFAQLTPEQKSAVIQQLAEDSRSGSEICSKAPRNVENCLRGWKIARSQGLTKPEFQCVDGVVMGESAWFNVPNAAGGRAYGIPQSRPGSKMASHGADWKTNPDTQIRWMLDYMRGRYGTFCKALSFKKAKGWY